MCMSTVTWQAKSRSNPRCPTKWQKGYKVFEVHDGIVRLPFQWLNGTQTIELSKTLKAKNKLQHVVGFDKKGKMIYKDVDLEITSSDGKPYLAGFHIFPIQKAASLYTIRCGKIFEVEYRKVTAEGTHGIGMDYPADCVIAQEMRVIRQLTDEEHAALAQGNDKLRA